MYFRRNGNITVFLCILLAALIPLCGILIDLARYNKAKKIAESSLKVCVESMLAAYDTQLKEQFGLFAMYPREDATSMEKEIYELFSDNLTPENSDGKVTDLFGFRVNRVEVVPIYNYSEPYVLEQQVAEFMKYRAPVQMIGEFLEKLKTMSGLMKEGDMVEKNMNIDKMLNSLRENMIFLSFLLGEKMTVINEHDSETYWQYCNKSIGVYLQQINDNKPAETMINSVNENMGEYGKVNSECDAAKAAYDSANASFAEVSNKMRDLENQIAALEAKKGETGNGGAQEAGEGGGGGEGGEAGEGSEETTAETSEIDIKIQALQEEINALRPEYDGLYSKNESARSAYEQELNRLRVVKEKLDACLNSVIQKYQAMNDSANSAANILMLLESHLSLHDLHCLKAIELIDAILPQAKEIQKEKDSLDSDIEKNPDSAVSGQIGADIDKKLLSVNTEALTDMRSRLEADEKQLAKWIEAVRKAEVDFDKAIVSLENQITNLNGIRSDPKDGSARITAYTGHDAISGCRDALVNSLMDFTAYSGMKSLGVYVIPEYETIPLPTDKEKKGFDIWYSNTFRGTEFIPEEQEDSGELDKAKTSIGGTTDEIAGVAVEDEEKFSLNDLTDLIASGSLILPSGGGSISSDANLLKIGENVYNTSREQGVNPFAGDPQGSGGKIDEKQKNFFDYELERIRKLLDIVTDLFSNAGESLVKSLYMNEYIVSAFKNYTTKNNSPEYDIGWDRPLDTTFFNKGEVEYVLFGGLSEQDNLSASKRSVFAIRLLFNLLHVYTSPGKVAEAFKTASLIAGWTIFGVPIVQNLILVGWAGLESWIDTGKLMNGERVPLIKTNQSWILQWNTLKAYLLNQLSVEVTDYLTDKAEEAIDEGAAYLEETVTSFIDAQVDLVFSGIEEEWQTINEEIGKEAQEAVGEIDFPDLSNAKSDTVDGFLVDVKVYISEQVASFCKKIEGAGAEFVEDCKTAIKNKLHDLIFESDAYKNLKEKVNGFAKETIKKGISAAADKAGSLLGDSTGRSSGANNVLGRLIMMDYTDYLRLMLLAVPPETKALRTSDLMQLNMYKTAPENGKPMSQYYTALYVKAYIDMNTWIIPESLFKKNNEGMITVEWTQGY